MDRKLKKIAKSDAFKEEFWHGLDFLTEHKAETIRYGSIGLALIVLGFGIFLYSRHQVVVREDALTSALKVDAGTVGNDVNPSMAANLHFNTEPEKSKAKQKAFGDLAAKYHGTQEGAIAEFYLASDDADQGDLAGLESAEKRFKEVLDSAPTPYASLARMSLAQVYEAEGRDADAEKLLREAVAHPTVTVSKEEATIALAGVIGKKNPAEASKLLEPLRLLPHRTAVSRAAVQAIADIAMNKK